MKSKFTKEVDGIKYQGELPLDVLDQLEMAQLTFFENAEDENSVDRINIKNKLDKMIVEHCNIVQGDKELLVKGAQKSGLTMKHLAQITSLYREELIIPLLD